MSSGTPDLEEVATVFRRSHGLAVASLARSFRDLSLAEDSVQDAFVVAVERWPVDGFPPNPAGWIITTARRRAIDRIRRSAKGAELEARLDLPDGGAEDEPASISDDRLRLIFTCCHPALRMEHRVALTLRLLGGLSVEEIARAFVVSESAMARRITRAKYKISAADIPYQVPEPSELPERVQGVLAVLYLVYNQGAESVIGGGSEVRAEAIRLAGALVDLIPDESEPVGLLALMLLNESRMPARVRGEQTVLLRDQDRSLWDRSLIDEGQRLVRDCIRRDRPGTYQLQAAVQAVHSAATSFESTDWRQIVTLYDHLYAMQPTATVALNRAIALGEADGADAALRALAPLDDRLDGYAPFHAAVGESRRRVGDLAGARRAFERALELTASDSDRAHLEQWLAGVPPE